MKSKLLLTVAAVLYILGGIAGFFMAGGYDYIAYGGAVTYLSLGVLFWLARDIPASKALTSMLLVGFIALFGGSLVALYGQYSGTYMDTAAGYIPGLIYLGLAIWFFLAWRANTSSAAS
ncbi:MAG: hypothetical protein IT314_01505 [Anaerolineales bacterium]|nr:hypothetical protein [Anaerolineales bacterium]